MSRDNKTITASKKNKKIVKPKSKVQCQKTKITNFFTKVPRVLHDNNDNDNKTKGNNDNKTESSSSIGIKSLNKCDNITGKTIKLKLKSDNINEESSEKFSAISNISEGTCEKGQSRSDIGVETGVWEEVNRCNKLLDLDKNKCDTQDDVSCAEEVESPRK